MPAEEMKEDSLEEDFDDYEDLNNMEEHFDYTPAAPSIR